MMGLEPHACTHQQSLTQPSIFNSNPDPPRAAIYINTRKNSTNAMMAMACPYGMLVTGMS